MSCGRCGSRCQGRYCQACEREVRRGARADTQPSPRQPMTDPIKESTDASLADHAADRDRDEGDDYPHQQQLASLAVVARAVYRELETADEPLPMGELVVRLRTPDRDIREGLRRLLEADLVERLMVAGETDASHYALTESEGQR